MRNARAIRTSDLVIARMQRESLGGRMQTLSLRGQASFISPFIGVEHYWMNGQIYPPHPHANMSALSYLLCDSQTGLTNNHTMGSPDLVRPGGLHWITAGRGMVHEELPIEAGKTVHGLQVFVALPRGGRDITPYQLSIEPEDVPLIEGDGFDVRVPVGHYADAHSPLKPPTNVTLLDIALDENAGLNVPIAAGHSFFALPITGTVEIAGQPFSRDALDVPVIRALHSPRTVDIMAQQGGAEVVVFSAPSISLL